jgi:pimeloyl-ACP methyl ester carboxylesterase
MDTLYLEREGGRIAFDDSRGGGEPVIMWPGMGTLRSEWRFLAPALVEAGYRVVTADLRGQGESSAGWGDYSIAANGQDFLALVEHLDAGPVHAVGNSFSPGAMVWAAAEKPDAFRSLTMIGPWVRDAEETLFQKVATAILLNGPWKVMGWAMFYKTLYPSKKPPDIDDYLDRLKGNLREAGRFEALKGLGFSPKTDSEKRISRVAKPALVVMGTKDPDWPDPAAEAEWIAQQLKAELLLVEGAGHYPMTEMPEKVIPGVLAFLASVNGDRAG